MKLITATPSPFARKVRVALLEKNISYLEYKYEINYCYSKPICS